MIKQILKDLGYTPIPDGLMMPVDLWKSWYEGKVSSFHEYRQFNGKRNVRRTRKSLCMAKRVCEDWADLIFNEKVEIKSADLKSQKALEKAFRDNHFRVSANRLAEQTFALGTGAFVEHKTPDGVMIDYIRADMIFPLAFENGEITECAFAGRMHVAGEMHTYLNVHVLEQGMYVVRNYLYNEKSKKSVPLPEGVAKEYCTGSAIPLFQIITPNLANNIAMDSPMGISIFANAIDVLEGIDLVYDSYQNEYRLGKKRIVVPLTMAKIQMEQQGEILPVFDDNDTEFYAFSGADPEDFSITEINMQLRADAHEVGLQRGIDLLTDACGFGTGKYKYSTGNLKTATQIVSEQSDMFRNLKKHELVAERAIRQLARAVLYLSGENPDAEIIVNFDDSIIEDSETVAERALLEVQNGIIDHAEYLSRVYKLPRETAEEMAMRMTVYPDIPTKTKSSEQSDANEPKRKSEKREKSEKNTRKET